MKFSNDLLSSIANANNVAIFTHVRPDGDCFGAASALKSALLQLGKKADIFCDGVIPDNYLFIKYIPDVNKQELKNYDTAIAVDCSDLSRLGAYSNLFTNIKSTISIDHHKSCNLFAKINHIENLPSTCEILYHLLKEMNITIDNDIANSLYSGISSDTGCYLHNSTTSDTHFITSELMKIGFDFDKANDYLFRRKTMGQIELQKIALNNIVYLCNNHLAITYITEKDFVKTGCDANDTTGLASMCANISGVNIGVLISEIKPNLFACSCRSGGNIDISGVCEKFGGGGHKNAAGCNIFGTYKTVISKIEKEVRDRYAGLFKC